MKQAILYLCIGMTISMVIGATLQVNEALLSIETARQALIKMEVVK